jgi:hypothetical protein
MRVIPISKRKVIVVKSLYPESFSLPKITCAIAYGKTTTQELTKRLHYKKSIHSAG